MNAEPVHYIGAVHAYRIVTKAEQGCDFPV
jgi:hypothetical protein